MNGEMTKYAVLNELLVIAIAGAFIAYSVWFLLNLEKIRAARGSHDLYLHFVLRFAPVLLAVLLVYGVLWIALRFVGA